MTNVGKQILNLMNDTNKSAPDITHALKVLGNGSMQKGLSRIRDFFRDEVGAAQNKGRIQGVIFGILGTAAFGSLIALNVYNKKKKTAHETEGQEIIKVLNSNVPASESSVDAMDSGNIGLVDGEI